MLLMIIIVVSSTNAEPDALSSDVFTAITAQHSGMRKGVGTGHTFQFCLWFSLIHLNKLVNFWELISTSFKKEYLPFKTKIKILNLFYKIWAMLVSPASSFLSSPLQPKLTPPIHLSDLFPHFLPSVGLLPVSLFSPCHSTDL